MAPPSDAPERDATDDVERRDMERAEAENAEETQGGSDISEAGSEDVERGEAMPQFPIVAIGASAGGIEAFIRLLRELPADAGMAILFVQHLDPTHDSRLSEIFSKVTQMQVLEAQDGMIVEADHVYVIPANATMAIEGGVLRITPRAKTRVLHLPIDHLFRSLAADRGTGAVAVLLSGTGTDGTLGMEEIKAAGGITFAQDEATAAFGGMPLNAMQSGCVDRMLDVESIAHELARICEHPYIRARLDVQLGRDDENFEKVLRLLHGAVGVDFRFYRDTTVRRRILRRMVLNTRESLRDYLAQLERDPAEVDALYQDILINVTSFFRNPDSFEALKVHVFPALVERNTGAPIRIWIPGCSTGQEAYSLAMVLLEYLADQHRQIPIQIFATDLSDRFCLQRARDGIYPASIEGEVSPERLRRFFVKEEDHYRVSKAIRDICVFAKQNVTADPPFSHVDIISCRNLLIYLAPPLQKRVIPTFHYSLNPGGFLLLGGAETVGGYGDLFAPVDAKHRVYVKKTAGYRQYPHFVTSDIPITVPAPTGRPAPPASTAADWQREADRTVLNLFAPCGVIINENWDVVQFRGHTGAFLAPAPGDASFNVLRMAREGLFLDLRGALNEARMSNAEVRREKVTVKNEAGTQPIELRVLPLAPTGTGERLFLVLFIDGGQALLRAKSGHGPAGGRSWLARLFAGPDGTSREPREESEEVLELRREIAATREYLQSVIEQQDAANEELKSANEEILSSNEELQSTNEELETAKEELQSVNEELTTVNEQLQNRNQELTRLNDDFANLLGSANVPMLALTADMRIRRFTPAAARFLNLLPGDVGRPITNLKPILDMPDLETVVAEVIDSVHIYERVIRNIDGRWFSLRVCPYRTADSRISGAVIVLQDVHEFRSQSDRLSQIVRLLDQAQDAVFARNMNTERVTSWNRGALRLYGWSEADAVGSTYRELVGIVEPPFETIQEALNQSGAWQGQIKYRDRSGLIKVSDSSQVLLRDEPGGEPSVLQIDRDVTGRIQLERDLQNAATKLAEADLRKNEFLAMLAHELRNPLAPLRHAIQTLRMMGSKDAQVTALQRMMDRQVTHIARLVDDLIDVARITKGRLELRKEVVSLGPVLAECLDNAREYAAGARQELVLTPCAEDLQLEADPVRLEQMLSNLLTNAIKFSDQPGTIHVNCERDGESAVVRIKDEGIGIGADILPYIWETFIQADGSLSRKRSGLGIGLALVRKLVELHGGTVEAFSDGLGKGSTFVVRLPLRVAGEVPAAAPPALAPPPAANASGKFRILIVDDNADAAHALATLLGLLGHEPRVARGGLEALEIEEGFKPEVVLLDIGLPGMNGYEVARRLRAKRGERPYIIAISGYCSSEVRERGLAAGFNQILTKPVEISALTALFQNVTA